jgi:tRNA U34 5-methylaminomethyl-2-thiouridine-forming methyltransferase MnmC
MKREVIQTDDGSSTIYIPEMDENYHSTHGAIQEAEHVFIQHGLRKMEEKGVMSISIFEMGFGTGLNAFLTKIRANSSIIYTGIEAFPVSEEELKALNYVDQLGTEFKDKFDSIHNANWDEIVEIDSQFAIHKVHAKIENYQLVTGSFDLIYFDAFGPRAQAEMWEIEILQNMYDGLKQGGALVTYCARGQFKRDLKSLGFELESLPGPPGKREMTRAWKV